jgi:4-hydroxy-3-polyprenylbenzoate decarboxylase
MARLNPRRRIVVAITGASGAIYGERLLRVLRDQTDVESHLIVSSAGERTIRHELGIEPQTLKELAHVAHDAADIGASIASGSFGCSGMVVAPCSMRTLAAIAHGLSDNLVTRAADVMLKERRRLVLLTREAPLHLGHIRNMASVTEMGAVVCPPVPAFYMKPRTIDDIVDQSVARVLDLLDIPHALCPRWSGEATHSD